MPNLFNKIQAVVLQRLGRKTFDKNEEGKFILTEEDKKTLKENHNSSADFIAKFEADLADLKDSEAAEAAENAEAENAKIAKLEADLTAARKKMAIQKTTIDLLSDSPEQDPKKEGNTINMQPKEFKPDMKMLHNKVIDNYFNGDGSLVSAADTIDVSELQTEFGKYITNYRYEIIRKLTQPVESTQHMTTVMAGTEWRATQSDIDSVVQQFTSKWTPLGSAEFTPLTIKNRKHKINVPITPADIMENYLGYLYDESLTPDKMPIVKYIVNELILPKVDEDREMKLLATGEYEEISGTPTDGDAGQATGKSMDGYCTILKDLYAAGNTDVTWLGEGIDVSSLTDKQLVVQIEKDVQKVSTLYKRKKMKLHIDPDLYVKFKRGYRDLYPTTKNEDMGNDRVDFTNFYFAPIAGMTGTNVYFITPKQNFKHLINKNKGASKIQMQLQNYDVKIFAEWWEAVGFAMAHAVFAHVPDSDSGSGSTGSAGSGSASGL